MTAEFYYLKDSGEEISREMYEELLKDLGKAKIKDWVEVVPVPLGVKAAI